MSKKVLLTGATGFLGQFVATELMDAGHKVVALCRNSQSKAARALPRAVKRARGDVLDAESVKKAARGCHVVLHCAGRVSRDMNDALEMTRLNVEGTTTVLDAAHEAGVGRAVVASTSGTVAVSEDPERTPDENSETPLHLINRWPYYRSKLYAEQEALSRNGASFEVLTINPTLLLGPGDRYGSSTEDVQRFLSRRIPAVPPGGISFVDARDAARGMILAMEKGRPGERYLLTAANWELRSFFDRLSRVSGVEAPLFNMPKAGIARQLGVWLAEKGSELLGPDTVPDAMSVDLGNHYWYADSSKAETELGWTYRDPMDTLLDTVNDLRERKADRARKSILTAHA